MTMHHSHFFFTIVQIEKVETMLEKERQLLLGHMTISTFQIINRKLSKSLMFTNLMQQQALVWLSEKLYHFSSFDILLQQNSHLI